MLRSQESGNRNQNREGKGREWVRLARWIGLTAIGCSLIYFLMPVAFSGPPAPQNESVQATAGIGGWREAEAGYQFQFPRDHAAHTDYAIEWWYYTGNLQTKDGRQFGYQLTFFRTGIARQPANPSRWAVRDLYMAHFAVSDITQKRFHFSDRINRAGIGWSGAATDTYHVWNEDWSVQLDGRDHVLSANSGDCHLDLRLASAKPEIIHGENGISQKGSLTGNASHYYSLTRLETSGRLTIGSETFDVTGLSWMDHEFGTSFLEETQTGWDWFSIQLDDGRELMLFEIRRRDGSIDPHSSGTLIDSNGGTTHIPFSEFSLSSSDKWRSPTSQAEYPTKWTIDLPRYQLKLTTQAAFENQELQTTDSTGVTYWEGSINIAGTAGGKPVSGRGYLEMTGYAGQNMGVILRPQGY